MLRILQGCSTKISRQEGRISDEGHIRCVPGHLDLVIITEVPPPGDWKGAVMLRTKPLPLFFLPPEFINDVEDYLSDQHLRFTCVGVQSSFGSPLRDLILFRAPRTGSTLAVPRGVLQMAKEDAVALVRARIAQNEEEFLRGTMNWLAD